MTKQQVGQKIICPEWYVEGFRNLEKQLEFASSLFGLWFIALFTRFYLFPSVWFQQPIHQGSQNEKLTAQAPRQAGTPMVFLARKMKGAFGGSTCIDHGVFQDRNESQTLFWEWSCQKDSYTNGLKKLNIF